MDMILLVCVFSPCISPRESWFKNVAFQPRLAGDRRKDPAEDTSRQDLMDVFCLSRKQTEKSHQLLGRRHWIFEYRLRSVMLSILKICSSVVL